MAERLKVTEENPQVANVDDDIVDIQVAEVVVNAEASNEANTSSSSGKTISPSDRDPRIIRRRQQEQEKTAKSAQSTPTLTPSSSHIESQDGKIIKQLIKDISELKLSNRTTETIKVSTNVKVTRKIIDSKYSVSDLSENLSSVSMSDSEAPPKDKRKCMSIDVGDVREIINDFFEEVKTTKDHIREQVQESIKRFDEIVDRKTEKMAAALERLNQPNYGRESRRRTRQRAEESRLEKPRRKDAQESQRERELENEAERARAEALKTLTIQQERALAVNKKEGAGPSRLPLITIDTPKTTGKEKPKTIPGSKPFSDTIESVIDQEKVRMFLSNLGSKNQPSDPRRTRRSEGNESQSRSERMSNLPTIVPPLPPAPLFVHPAPPPPIPQPQQQLRFTDFRPEDKFTEKSDYEIFRRKVINEISAYGCEYVLNPQVQPWGRLTDEDRARHEKAVLNFITRNVSEPIFRTIMEIKTPLEIMERLSKQSLPKGEMAAFELRETIGKIRYDPTKETAIEYNNRFSELVSRIRRITKFGKRSEKHAYIAGIIEHGREVVRGEEARELSDGKGFSIQELKEQLEVEDAQRREAARR